MAWALPTQHKERWWWEGSLGSSCRVRVVEGPGVVPEVAAGLAHGGLQHRLRVQSSQQLANPRTCSAPWHRGLGEGGNGKERGGGSCSHLTFVLSSAAEAGGLGWCCLEWEKGAGEGAALLFLGGFWHFFWQRVRPASHPGSGWLCYFPRSY